MIVVLASAVDDAAVAFSKEFENTAALTVVTCRDLAEGSTILRSPGFLDSSISVRGRTICVKSIDGVINVLPAIVPDELFFYSPEEREYQASEFRALLTFFLCALPCPVVNRPLPSSISGPCAKSIAWYHLAAELGIPTRSLSIDASDPIEPRRPQSRRNVFELICLGGRLISRSGTAADPYTIALWRRAGVEYLKAAYSDASPEGPKLVSVNTTVELDSLEVRRALVSRFDRAFNVA